MARGPRRRDGTSRRRQPATPERLSARTIIIVIGAIIAIPLIFAALGASESAGIVFGVLLVVVGLGWTLLGSRNASGE